MRLEQLPLVIGVIVALLGLVLLGDAFVADRGGPPLGERRRRARAERDRPGEGAVGLGLLCMAAALIGRDTWRYGNVAVLAGTILLVAGTALNHRFIRELLLFRGPARRQPERQPRGPEVARRHGEAAGEGESAVPAVERAPEDPGEVPREQPHEQPHEQPQGQPQERPRLRIR